ncbi:DUF3046 domain-containing protein [Nocardioides sp.]|uniref:DUF3046 domain-containing protein n=1 Tax=Nocardioides sp. TaxID=35761 RepID=UPI00351709F3
MRYTEFRARMSQALGARAESWAEHTTITALGSRTVEEALAAGLTPREVWAAVAEMLEIPEHQR